MKRITRGVLFLFIFPVYIGCDTPVEACIDSNASNYNVEADDNCCCEYPEIRLNYSHTINGNQFKSDSTIINDFGQSFNIAAAAFYIYDLSIDFDDGSVSDIIEKVEIVKNGTTNSFEDNFALIRSDILSKAVGTNANNGLATGIRFSFGLPADIDVFQPSDFESAHVLGENNEDLYDESQEKYERYQWMLTEYKGTTDTLFVEDITSGPLNTFSFSIDTTYSRGAEINLNLQIDYYQWLKGIDFDASLTDVQSKIVENSISAITLNQ